MSSILDGLNDAQREAVQAVDGPVLILAGAGSGKTRVLTRRIAYLLSECGVNPSQILAMTFTNKAAGEMRERVEDLLHRSCKTMWIGTFHSLCARLLRSQAEQVGLRSSFTIYDTTDQLALLRRVLADEELSERDIPARLIRTRISQAKNQMVGVDVFAQRASTFREQIIARVFRHYQDALKQNNAVDFDDLLTLSVELIRDHEDVRKTFQAQFSHILIDEYQDTNRPQYLFARYLAELHQNICVVGDDDQSIYAWRGADIRNILDFEADYPNAFVVRLEQNYRSTQVILDAGNALIRNNAGRKGKELWTDRARGEKIRLKRCADEAEEARWIAGVTRDFKRAHTYRDMAVLYRTNAQSRALEEGFRRANIPYQIVGDVRFYERKEVKDVLAYLKLVVNPRDSIGFWRVINTPRRGIGATSAGRLDEFAMREGLAPYQALAHLDAVDGLPARTARAMCEFYDMVEGFRQDMEAIPADELAAKIVDETGYLRGFEKLLPEEQMSRRAHVAELLTDIQIFVEQSDDVSLEAYLRKVSLVTDVDQWENAADAVTLMTLHSAKGLEFPIVFVTGLEDGLFPILRPAGDGGNWEDALEEERRLFYVGITRAQDRLFLSYAMRRQLFLSYAMRRQRYDGAVTCSPSQFLSEIPEDLLDGERVLMDVGAWVIHPTWGRGQIQSRTGSGQKAKLKVKFDDGTVKTIIVEYANLQPG